MRRPGVTPNWLTGVLFWDEPIQRLGEYTGLLLNTASTSLSKSSGEIGRSTTTFNQRGEVLPASFSCSKGYSSAVKAPNTPSSLKIPAVAPNWLPGVLFWNEPIQRLSEDTEPLLNTASTSLSRSSGEIGRSVTTFNKLGEVLPASFSCSKGQDLHLLFKGSCFDKTERKKVGQVKRRNL